MKILGRLSDKMFLQKVTFGFLLSIIERKLLNFHSVEYHYVYYVHIKFPYHVSWYSQNEFCEGAIVGPTSVIDHKAVPVDDKAKR